MFVEERFELGAGVALVGDDGLTCSTGEQFGFDLEEISGTRELTAPGRIIGRLHARLCYHDDAGPALPLLDDVQTELAKTHDAVDVLYFGT